MDDAPIQIDFRLHEAQMQVFRDKSRFRVLVAGRRFGKTTLAIAEAVCAALDPANRLHQPVYLIAPTQAQAKLLYWRPLVDKLHPLMENQNSNEGLIFLKNRVMIGVKGADNPDTLRGPGLFFAVMDEYASMKPFVWEEIVRPALTDSAGRAMFIGTPAGRNHFHALYTMATEEMDPDFRAWHFASVENPFLPKGELEKARRIMSSAAFNKEYLASFDTAGGTVFKPEWIQTSEIEPANGEKFVVVDLCGFTGIEKATTSKQRLLDEHVIVTAKVTIPNSQTGEQDWWIKDVQKGRWGVKECAKRIVDVLEDEKPYAWGVEKGALFNAVMPEIIAEARSRDLWLPTVVPLSHENRIKNERIVWALQGRMEHGRIKFFPGRWMRDVEDQLTNFPSRMVHDDIPDALSYVAQISQGRVHEDFSHLESDPYWEPEDKIIGF